MKWTVADAFLLEKVDVDEARLWRMILSEGAIQPITIGLCLLWNKLVSSVELKSDQGVFCVSRDQASFRRRATVTWKKCYAGVLLSETELEMWMFFFLRTVRDGVAEVDHIDMDAAPLNDGDIAGSFTIQFPNFAPPVSSDEARRRLGLKARR